MMTGSTGLGQGLQRPSTEPVKKVMPGSKSSAPLSFDEIFACSPFKRVAEATRIPGFISPTATPSSVSSPAPLSPTVRRLAERPPQNLYTPPHLRKKTVSQSSTPSPEHHQLVASGGLNLSPVRPIPSFGKVDGTPIKPELYVKHLFPLCSKLITIASRLKCGEC